MEGVEQFSNYYKKLNSYININQSYNFDNINNVTNFILTDSIPINFSEINRFISHVSLKLTPN